MIRLEQIHKSFRRIEALKGVSLTVAKGEIVALLGPNGAGKTTLLKALVGLLHPTSGTILVDGIDLTQNPRAALARIGFVPQRVCFPPHLTVTQVLGYFADLKGVSREAGVRALDRVGLDRDGHRRVCELSGGMLQRLGLAQSLLADPPLLVLDEPTVGLDPRVSCEFRDLLCELNAGGTTIVLTSHLLGEVERLAHRVAILKEGSIVALDTIPHLMAASGLPSALWVKPAGDLARVHSLLTAAGMPAERVGATLRIDTIDSSGLDALDLLRREGATIESFWTTTPTLEEVFRWVVERKNG